MRGQGEYATMDFVKEIANKRKVENIKGKGGEKVLEKAITQVKDAEEQAERILTEAREQAAAVLQKAQEEGAALKDQRVKEARAEAEKKLQEAKVQGEKQQEESLRQIENEKKALERAAAAKEAEVIAAVTAQLV